MGVVRSFIGGSGKDEGEEILIWGYTDDAGGGVKDCLIAKRSGDGSSGFLIPGLSTYLICVIKNNSGSAIAWEEIPKWKGTNDPDIVTPATTDGFNLTVGDGKVVDQAYGSSLAAGEEQGTIINCNLAPRAIFLTFDPPSENLDLSLFVRENVG